MAILAVAQVQQVRAQDQPPEKPAESRADEETLQIPRSSDPGKQPFVRQFFVDEWAMWTSPFRKSTYANGEGVRYVLPFVLVTGALIATDQHTAQLLPNTTDQSTWSLRVSQIGAPYTLAGVSAAMYLISRATGDKKARETGFFGAEAILHNQLITPIFKMTTQRERPLDFHANDHSGTAFFRGGDSFPSGHASGSFALATIFSLEYGHDHKWVPFVAYGLAGLVAASRLSAQKHWVSDIFVGGTMGVSVGRFVYRNHHVRRVDGPRSRTSRLVPELGFGAGTVNLNWKL